MSADARTLYAISDMLGERTAKIAHLKREILALVTFDTQGLFTGHQDDLAATLKIHGAPMA